MKSLLEKKREFIDKIEEVKGITHSPEQREILEHSGGMKIVACAGSGKTTTLTELLAVRILSGEMNSNEILCTTYSRDGAREIESRYKELTNKLGFDSEISVKTLHATYYEVLKVFGILKTICSDGKRKMLIIKACKEVEVELEDEDLDLLSTLISFQVNNLLSDEKVVNSPSFTLENVTLQNYSDIRKTFNKLKTDEDLMDYDDMQLWMYALVKPDSAYREQVLAYCRSKWKYYLVDEFQDTSKIQYSIIKALVDKTENLIVIGDDDQCLIEGTNVRTIDGYKKIEEIRKGDKLLVCAGHGEVAESVVGRVSRKKCDEEVYTIITKKGYKIKGTYNHVGFAKNTDKTSDTNESVWKENRNGKGIKELEFDLFGGDKKGKSGKYNSKLTFKCDEYNRVGNIETDCLDLIECSRKGVLETEAGLNEVSGASLTKKLKYEMVQLKDMRVGMKIPVYNGKKVIDDEIKEIKVESYTGYVYDISLPDAWNFIADDIVVHNCIYKWRGADPSIILNIESDYEDMKSFVLPTNYRCGEEILNFASRGIECLPYRHQKDMKAFNSGGEVKFKSVSDKDWYLASKDCYAIIQDLKESGVDNKDICVMVRNNVHGIIIANMLLHNEIYVDMAENMKMSNFRIYKDYKDIFEMAEDTYNYNLVRRSIWKVVPYFGAKGAQIITDIMSNSGLSLKQTLQYFLSNFHNCKDLDKLSGIKLTNVKIPNKIVDKIEYKVRTIKVEAMSYLEELFKVMCTYEEDKNKAVKWLLLKYAMSTEFIYNNPDTIRIASGMRSYFTAFIDQYGLDELKKFMLLTENYEGGNAAVLDTRITVTTMHSSKGLEWDNVIILGCDNYSFPKFSSIQEYIERGVNSSEIEDYLDGERRLHYVAVTRAKKKLFILAEYRNLCVYTLECMGLFNTGDNNADIVVMGMSGKLSDTYCDRIRQAIEHHPEYFLDIKDC